MRGKLKRLITQTPREKTATVDGISLFFGALLGANLGTLDGLGLYDYGTVIFILACTVMTLRLFSTSERRGFALAMLALYVAVIVVFLVFQRPAGLAAADAERLMVTLGVWLGAVILVELYPTRTAED